MSSSGSDRLKSASSGLMSALGEKAISSVGDRVTDLTGKLEDVANGSPAAKTLLGSGKAAAEGEGPVTGGLKGAAAAVKDTVKDKVTGGGGGNKSPKATKATNIVETIDVGVPVRVAYNQWTEFGGFPSFMKKVEKVDAQEDNKLEWKAQIVWSHRTWQATILEQVPDERIVWRSQGEKGHVDGAVTFHEIGPNLTRILVVLEYYPQGLFERTGNIWRAQGRRARAELKHFRRHVMTRTILHPDEVEGWRGRIEDGEVVETHEDALEHEDEYDESEDEQGDEDESYEDEPEDEYEESDEDDESDEEPEDEYEDEPDEEEPEDEYEESDEEPEDEYEDEDEPDEEEPEDEYEESDEDEEYEEYEEEPDDARHRRAS